MSFRTTLMFVALFALITCASTALAQVHILEIPPEAWATFSFGRSVDIDGDRAVVAGFMVPGVGPFGAGAVWVYEHQGENWVLTATLTASDTGEDWSFGSDVAIEGDRILVGALGAYGSSGRTYVFELHGESWSETAILEGSGVVGFGMSVALYGDKVAVKAATALFIFERAGGVWLQTAVFPLDYNWGGEVALDGDRAFLSSPLNVYALEGEKWSLEETLPGVVFDVSVSDGRLVTCHPFYNREWIFEWDGEGWIKTAELTSSLGQIGRTCDIEGDVVVVGASGGFVSVIMYTPDGDWEEVSILYRDWSGWRGPSEKVALSGDFAIAGNGGDIMPSQSPVIFEGLILNNVAAEEGPPDTLPALSVYPNPTTGLTQLEFHLTLPSPVRLEVFDVTGRRVQDLHVGALLPGTHRLGLDLSALPPGLYFCGMTGEGLRVSRRIAVVR